MDQGESDFYIVLGSHGCTNFNPQNSASEFITNFEQNIELAGNWKVALTEFKCNFPIYTLPAGASIITREIKGFRLEVSN